MPKNKMALKPYVEAIEQLCSRLSHDELKTLIINIAKETPVRERKDFLEKLYSYSTAAKPPPNRKNAKEKIFHRIDAVKEEIQERIESIEDGSYWDFVDYDDFEEEVDSISEEQTDDLIGIFEEADNLFLDGRLELARDIYQRLFQAIREFDEIDNSAFSCMEKYDLKEARSRYCRCIYETVPKKDRVGQIMAAIDINANISERRLGLEQELYPMLCDIIEALPGDMKDLDSFLKDWISALEKQQSNRAATLLAEAVFFTKGTDGVSELARKWGSNQPRGYLYWIECLINEGHWKQAAGACLEALDKLPRNSFREQAAGYLVEAGAHLSDNSLILQGKREQLISVPGEENLLDFVEEAGKQKVREAELEALQDIIRKSVKSSPGDNIFYTRYLLMSGKVKEAFVHAKSESKVGWSDGRAGLVFGGVLYIVCGKSRKAKTINDLLNRYAETPISFSWKGPGNAGTSMYEEILKGLDQFEIGPADEKEFWNWAKKIGRARIDHIVSNKHRGAYDRAAAVLGSLCECLLLCHRKNDAQKLAHEFYSEKYNRHSAFRREVKSVFSSSEVLAAISL
ncbi:MAG: hypothetical protein KGY38_04630 [Desulfobacterales bacterium]|nr:hypothetical protein [Desulfobacterales bacterium]